MLISNAAILAHKMCALDEYAESNRPLSFAVQSQRGMCASGLRFAVLTAREGHHGPNDQFFLQGLCYKGQELGAPFFVRIPM